MKQSQAAELETRNSFSSCFAVGHRGNDRLRIASMRLQMSDSKAPLTA